jgi:urea carboxylase
MSRYSWGADEFLFVELAEEMSLRANFRAMAIATKLRERRPDGLLDICPANASYQVRFDPDRLEPAALEALLREVDEEVGDAHGFTLDTRVVEVPVLYDDPWTTETLMRFRDRHQEPDSTDLEYAARINGFDSKAEFIAAHAGAPWFASMVGFVAGLPFLYQMVPRERQLEVPKYVRPRTDTPALTIGHGGCFGCIYSVRGAGGYQMFGIAPVPIYEPGRGEVFFKGGDIVKFSVIDRDRYDALHADPPALRSAPVSFDLDEFEADPDAYNRGLLEVLG